MCLKPWCVLTPYDLIGAYPLLDFLTTGLTIYTLVLGDFVGKLRNDSLDELSLVDYRVRDTDKTFFLDVETELYLLVYSSILIGLLTSVFNVFR